MSAIPTPSSASPAQAPEPVMPPSVAPAPEKRPGSRLIWWILAGVIVVAAGAWLLSSRARQKPGAAVTSIRTFKVVPGAIRKTVRLTGTTAAGSFANISAPVMRAPDAGRGMVLIFLAKAGSMVKKGDLVAQIDAQAVKDHIDDVQATVVQAEADITKRKAEQAIEMETLRQTLRTAKATLDKAKLDFAAQEIRTVIDQELLKLTVEESEAQYNELQQDIKTTEEGQRIELRLLDLARDKNVRHRNRHQFDLDRFTIKAPMAGLIVMQTLFRGGDMGQVQLGDQIFPGQPFMKIVDPSSMRMDASINQADSEKIRIGQPATLAFDAFADLHLAGKVYAVGALAVAPSRQQYYIRNVPVELTLAGQDPRVIPDLSAAADITIASSPDTLAVPLEAVREQGSSHIVYVKAGNGWAGREVKLGMASNTRVEILEGLKAGDEIALQEPVLTAGMR